MKRLTKSDLNTTVKRSLFNSGFRLVTTLDDSDLYTDDDVKELFKSYIKNQNTFKSNYKKINELIDSDIVIPVYVKKGLVKTIMHSLFKNLNQYAASSFNLAFYEKSSRKIFVLIENVNNINYWKKEEALSLVLLHELQHMTADYFPRAFLRVHSKSLTRYYSEFFNLQFEIESNDKEIFNIISWVFLQTEGGNWNKNIVKDYYDRLYNLAEPFYDNKKELKKELNIFFNIVIIYFKDPISYIRGLKSRNKDMLRLYLNLRDSYKALKITQEMDSIFIQETLVPSEVICMESEFNTTNNHFVLINKIRA